MNSAAGFAGLSEVGTAANMRDSKEKDGGQAHVPPRIT
jgi:hypothetical protein